MPIGMPIATPTATDTEDCQATEAPSWRPVNPSAFRRASSRRRRRTEETRVSPRAPSAPPARTEASRVGVDPTAP